MLGVKPKIRYNETGQLLTFEAPQGRPASATVVLVDPRYAVGDASRTILASAAATLKVVDTTVTTASGVSTADDKKVLCTPPAALAAGDYVLLANAEGQSERKKVKSKAATYFMVTDDMVFDYAIGATIKSAVMQSAGVPSAFVTAIANLGEDYYAEWTYTINSVQYVERQYFDLVREVVDIVIADSDLLGWFPDLKRWTWQNQPGTFEPQIASAQIEVEQLLNTRNIKLSLTRGVHTVKFLVALKTLEVIASAGVHPQSFTADAHLTNTRDKFERYWNLVVNGTLKIPYDGNEDDVISKGEKRTENPILGRK